MQFMPRMSAAEKARIQRELNEVDPATGKTGRELMYEAIGDLKTNVPVHLVGDDVEPPAFVKEAQAKLNRMTAPPPPSPAQTRDDLRKMLEDWLED